MAISIFSLPPSSALLFFSVAFGLSSALPWSGAEKTGVYKRDEWSPRPTNIPVDPAKLFKRSSVAVDVCGWIGGNSAQPVSCGSGSSCIHDTIHGYIGCCTTSGLCTAGVYTSCVDKNSAGYIPNSGVQANGIYTCSSDSVCYRDSYPGGYFQYNCGPSSQEVTVQTSYVGQPSDLRLQVVFTGVNFNPASAAATLTSQTSSSSTPTSSPTSSYSSSTISSSSTTAAAATSGKAASTKSSSASLEAAAHLKKVKAITGGVVGGLAGLTAICGVISYLLIRRRTQRNAERAGSFVSRLQYGKQLPYGPFLRMDHPYSPDDFAFPPMVERRNTLTTAASLPPYHLMAPEPTVLPHEPSTGREETVENSPLISLTEIENFSRSYNDAIASHLRSQESPPRTAQSRPDAFSGTTAGAGVGSRAPLLRRSGSGSSNSDGDDASGPDSKAEPVQGFRSENVRAEGWSPQQLLSPTRDAAPRRYQLVDTIPTDSVSVLQSMGKLRGTRGRNSN